MLCIDGQIMRNELELTGLWLCSEGMQFGFGVFETLRVYKGEPEDLYEHLARLTASADRLGIHLPEILMQPDALRELLKPLLSETRSTFNSLKIGLLKDGNQSHYWTQVKPFPYKRVHIEKGICATISNVHRNSSSLFAYHKTMNYAENWYEKQKAVENGYQEVLFLNENHCIAEGAISNLFFLKKGIWHTPAVDCGILNGIMRRRTIDRLTGLQVRVEEGYYDLAALETAEQVFVTNALMGIVPVHRIDDWEYQLPDQTLNNLLQQIDDKRLMFE